MIPFNKSPYTGSEDGFVNDAIKSRSLSGDGKYTRLCQKWIETKLGCRKSLLTPSCTHALEMAAILIDIQPGDEVIMPSYTFVSTANAFVLRGARIVFVDICADTMNINADEVRKAITTRTKAIVPVHYGGMVCNIEEICDIASDNNLYVIEDAAQAILAKRNGSLAGTFGHMAAFSFHETKNITSGGEGGALIINDEQFLDRAEIVREKGTNRSQFFRGLVDKYTWYDIGSSYLPSELQSAYLWGQMVSAEQIIENRISTWNLYRSLFYSLIEKGDVICQSIPQQCSHNGHMFYIKCKNLDERGALIDYLKEKGVMAVFHYVPLHSTAIGRRCGVFSGEDKFTTKESDRLIRLPMWYGIDETSVRFIVDSVNSFFLK